MDHLFCHLGMMKMDLEGMIVVGRHMDSLFLGMLDSSNPDRDSDLLFSDTVEEKSNEEEAAALTSILNSPPSRLAHTSQDVIHVVLTEHMDYKATSVDYSVRSPP
jgi:hypothetical protein